MAAIADQAGVSRTTVSFILNKNEANTRISQETRQKVLSVAEALGYRLNEPARAMITGGKQRIIVYLSKNPEREFRAKILTAMIATAEGAGYAVQVIRLHDRSVDAEIINRCSQMRPSGVIVQHVNAESLEYLRQEMGRWQVPVVAVDSIAGGELLDCISADEFQGCRIALEYLISLGHQRIAVMSGIVSDAASQLREQAYWHLLHEHGLPICEEYLGRGNWEVEPTEQETRRLLALPQRPTALLCLNDPMAMVALRVARRCGFSVPEQLSVIGFGDFAMATLADPPLTSIAQPLAEMGELATRHLLNRIRQGQTAKTAVDENKAEISQFLRALLPCQLIVRESCASVPIA
jgi:DNA-binding LacI/PurR family transcriptional regulator